MNREIHLSGFESANIALDKDCLIEERIRTNRGVFCRIQIFGYVWDGFGFNDVLYLSSRLQYLPTTKSSTIKRSVEGKTSLGKYLKQARENRIFFLFFLIFKEDETKYEESRRMQTQIFTLNLIFLLFHAEQ